MPDAYGRGRIIGDYRRVALYGVERLIAQKREERAQVDDMWPTEAIIRTREELAEQIRVLEWQKVSFLILMILIAVAVIDWISGKLRFAIIGKRAIA